MASVKRSIVAVILEVGISLRISVCNHAAPDVHWHFAVTHTREIARGDVGVGVGPMSSNQKCRSGRFR